VSFNRLLSTFFAIPVLAVTGARPPMIVWIDDAKMRSRLYKINMAISYHVVASIQRAARARCCPFSFHRLAMSSSASIAAPSKLVRWDVEEKTRIGTITLQSPSTYNALTVEMGNEFRSLIAKIQRDDFEQKINLNVIILTGEGGNAFSAGGNLEWLRSLSKNSVYENADAMLAFYNSFLCIRKVPVPVIAAMPGPAIGAGACLALACDLRVASPKATLGFNFSRLGIHSGMGGSHLLMRTMGGPCGLINELLLTGKVLSAQEAKLLGLINRIGDDSYEEAHKLAAEISRQNPLAVRTMIKTLRQQQDEGLEANLQHEALAQALCYSRGDWGEGLDAVVEKRDPVFKDYHEN
jgi:enoyl-CoA hydratase/carnithine racemase